MNSQKPKKIYMNAISILIAIVFMITSLGINPAYAEDYSAHTLSPQSVFSPLTDLEIKEIAMLRYVAETAMLSERVDLMDEVRDRSSISMGVNFGLRENVDIKFYFSQSTVYENGDLRLVPCYYKNSQGEVTGYWMAVRWISDGLRVEFFTNRERTKKEFLKKLKKLIELEELDRAMDPDFKDDGEAINRSFLSEKEHDSRIRQAIGEGKAEKIVQEAIEDDKYVIIDGKKYNLSLTYIYAFLDLMGTGLSRDLKALIDEGQLMVITGKDEGRNKLTSPHAGGQGIYLPNNKRYITPSTIVHEVFAKAGFTHRECQVFEKLFKRFASLFNDDEVDASSKLPEEMEKDEEVRLYRDLAKGASFVALEENMKERDYSMADDEESKAKSEREKHAFDELVLQIQESERKYRALFEGTPDGVAIHELVLDEEGRPVDYVFMDVNDAFLTHSGLGETLGLAKDDLIGRKVTEVIPGIENDSADWIGRYGKVVLTGEPVRFEQFSELLGRYFEVSAYKPYPDKMRFATVFKDITEAKKAAKMLADERNRMRELINNIPDTAIYIKDTEKRFVTTNRFHLKIMGKTEDEIDEVIGKTDMELFPKDRAREYLSDEDRVLQGEEIRNKEEAVIDSEGNEKVFLTTKVPLKNSEGEVTGLIGVSTDVTEFAAMRNETIRNQRLSALGTTAAMVAHELRTPLSVVIGAEDRVLELCERGSYSSIPGLLKETKAELLKMSDIIARIHEVAEGPPKVEKPYAFFLAEAIGMSLKEIQPSAEKADIKITTEIDETLCVEFDKGQLSQAFSRILNNAVDALEEVSEEERTITVTARKAMRIRNRQKEEYIRVEVRDNGPGADQEDVEKWFDLGYTTKRLEAYKGMGLGLTRAQGIIENANGQITAKSEKGKGTVFTIGLPLSSKVPEERSPEEIYEEMLLLPLREGGDFKRILIVEDEQRLADTYTRFLSEYEVRDKTIKHDITIVNNGQEALEAVEKEHAEARDPFDLVLLDFSMPVMNGDEFAARFRMLEEEKALRKGKTMIIMLTGYDAGELYKSAKQLEEMGIIDKVALKRDPSRAGIRALVEEAKRKPEKLKSLCSEDELAGELARVTSKEKAAQLAREGGVPSSEEEKEEVSRADGKIRILYADDEESMELITRAIVRNKIKDTEDIQGFAERIEFIFVHSGEEVLRVTEEMGLESFACIVLDNSFGAGKITGTETAEKLRENGYTDEMGLLFLCSGYDIATLDVDDELFTDFLTKPFTATDFEGVVLEPVFGKIKASFAPAYIKDAKEKFLQLASDCRHDINNSMMGILSPYEFLLFHNLGWDKMLAADEKGLAGLPYGTLLSILGWSEEGVFATEEAAAEVIFHKLKMVKEGELSLSFQQKHDLVGFFLSSSSSMRWKKGKMAQDEELINFLLEESQSIFTGEDREKYLKEQLKFAILTLKCYSMMDLFVLSREIVNDSPGEPREVSLDTLKRLAQIFQSCQVLLAEVDGINKGVDLETIISLSDIEPKDAEWLRQIHDSDTVKLIETELYGPKGMDKFSREAEQLIKILEEWKSGDLEEGEFIVFDGLAQYNIPLSQRKIDDYIAWILAKSDDHEELEEISALVVAACETIGDWASYSRTYADREEAVSVMTKVAQDAARLQGILDNLLKKGEETLDEKNFEDPLKTHVQYFPQKIEDAKKLVDEFLPKAQKKLEGWGGTLPEEASSVDSEKEAKDAIARSEDEMREDFDSSILGIAILDEKLTLTDSNSAFKALLGTSEVAEITISSEQNSRLENCEGVEFETTLGETEVLCHITPIGGVKDTTKPFSYLVQVQNLEEYKKRQIKLEEIQGKIAELSALPVTEKVFMLQTASIGQKALVYAESRKDALKAAKRLSALGFRGEIVTAVGEAELKEKLSSDGPFDVIINTTNKELKEILSSFDSIPEVIDADNVHLRERLITICA